MPASHNSINFWSDSLLALLYICENHENINAVIILLNCALSKYVLYGHKKIFLFTEIFIFNVFRAIFPFCIGHKSPHSTYKHNCWHVGSLSITYKEQNNLFLKIFIFDDFWQFLTICDDFIDFFTSCTEFLA